jgi:hypothetical protein
MTTSRLEEEVATLDRIQLTTTTGEIKAAAPGTKTGGRE